MEDFKDFLDILFKFVVCIVIGAPIIVISSYIAVWLIGETFQLMKTLF